MRILYIISSLKIGGAETALANLVPAIAHNHNVAVAYFHDGPTRQLLEQHQIPVYPITGFLHHYDPSALMHLYQLIKQFKPTIIHTSLWSANIVGRILGKLTKIPVVSDLHGNCQFEGTVRNWGDRLTASWSASTVAVSDGVAAAYQTQILHNQPPSLASTKLIIIKNSIDTTKLALIQPLTRAELGIPPHAFVIGAVGRLEPIKGYDLLLQAFAQQPNNPARPVWLCLVGDGSQMASLQAYATQHHLTDRIIFAGFRRDATRFYPLFDCFALSSVSEGISMALLEALYFGCPVITTHRASTHEVITQGTHGLLVTTRSVPAYTAALAQLYNNPEGTTNMRTACHELVMRNYALPRVVAAYEQIYAHFK